MELLTGRPPTADESEDGSNDSARLTTWIRPHLTTRRPNLAIIMDPRLEGKYPQVAAHKLLVLAKHCVSDDPQARPQIFEMLKTLKQIAEQAANEDYNVASHRQEHKPLEQSTTKVEEEEARIGSLGPLHSTSSSNGKSISKAQEESSFDSTKKVFGETLAPR